MQNGNSKTYRFAHDLMQMAASSLLPEDPREIFLHINKNLCAVYSHNELDGNIFVVTHLLHNSADLVSDQTEHLKSSELFLQACNEAITSTAFTQAFKYLEAGK